MAIVQCNYCHSFAVTFVADADCQMMAVAVLVADEWAAAS